MNYDEMDNQQLKRLANNLRYDAKHRLDETKRAQAKLELMKVEAILRRRQGIQGLFHQIKQLLGFKTKG